MIDWTKIDKDQAWNQAGKDYAWFGEQSGGRMPWSWGGFGQKDDPFGSWMEAGKPTHGFTQPGQQGRVADPSLGLTTPGTPPPGSSVDPGPLPPTGGPFPVMNPGQTYSSSNAGDLRNQAEKDYSWFGQQNREGRMPWYWGGNASKNPDDPFGAWMEQGQPTWGMKAPSGWQAPTYQLGGGDMPGFGGPDPVINQPQDLSWMQSQDPRTVAEGSYDWFKGATGTNRMPWQWGGNARDNPDDPFGAWVQAGQPTWGMREPEGWKAPQFSLPGTQGTPGTEATQGYWEPGKVTTQFQPTQAPDYSGGFGDWSPYAQNPSLMGANLPQGWSQNEAVNPPWADPTTGQHLQNKWVGGSQQAMMGDQAMPGWFTSPQAGQDLWHSYWGQQPRGAVEDLMGQYGGRDMHWKEMTELPLQQYFPESLGLEPWKGYQAGQNVTTTGQPTWVEGTPGTPGTTGTTGTVPTGPTVTNWGQPGPSGTIQPPEIPTQPISPVGNVTNIVDPFGGNWTGANPEEIGQYNTPLPQTPQPNVNIEEWLAQNIPGWGQWQDPYITDTTLDTGWPTSIGDQQINMPGQWQTAGDVMQEFARGKPTPIPEPWQQARGLMETLKQTGLKTDLDLTGWEPVEEAATSGLPTAIPQSLDRARELYGSAARGVVTDPESWDRAYQMFQQGAGPVNAPGDWATTRDYATQGAEMPGENADWQRARQMIEQGAGNIQDPSEWNEALGMIRGVSDVSAPEQWAEASRLASQAGQSGFQTQAPGEWGEAGDFYRNMMGTGQAVSTDPWYTEAQKVTGRNIEDAIKQSNEQAGVTGLRDSTVAQAQAADIASKYMNELNMNWADRGISALENARQRQMDSAGGLGDIGSQRAALGESAAGRQIQGIGLLQGLGGDYANLDQANRAAQMAQAGMIGDVGTQRAALDAQNAQLQMQGAGMYGDLGQQRAALDEAGRQRQLQTAGIFQNLGDTTVGLEDMNRQRQLQSAAGMSALGGQQVGLESANLQRQIDAARGFESVGGQIAGLSEAAKQRQMQVLPFYQDYGRRAEGLQEAAAQRQLQVLPYMSQLGGQMAGLSESAMDRGLQAAQSLIPWGEQSMRIPMDMAQQMMNMSIQSQGAQQAQLDSAYQEWLRTTPEASPWLQYALQAAQLPSQMAPQQYGQSPFSQLLGIGGMLGSAYLGRPQY